MDGWMNVCVYGWMGGWMYVWMNVSMDECMDGRMDGCACMYGWVVECINGW